MYQEFFMGRSLLELPVLAMILFIATFTLVVLKVWRQDPKDPTIAEITRLPLEDDQT